MNGQLLRGIEAPTCLPGAAAYVVVAWLILQVVNNVAPGLNLPNSAVTLVIVLLAAGFPIALIFAWIFDFR